VLELGRSCICLHKVQDTFSIKVKIVKSIFTNASYVTLQIYFSHPSCSNFFSNRTHKTDTGTASTWETTNSKPLGPIKLSNQSKIGRVNKYDLTLFLRLFQDYESCTFFRVPELFQWIHWIWVMNFIQEV